MNAQTPDKGPNLHSKRLRLQSLRRDSESRLDALRTRIRAIDDELREINAALDSAEEK